MKKVDLDSPDGFADAFIDFRKTLIKEGPMENELILKLFRTWLDHKKDERVITLQEKLTEKSEDDGYESWK